jgi:hypothetical protein
LLEAGFQSSDAEAEVSYAMSGLAARRLLQAGRGPAVGALLSDLGLGMPIDEAFAHRALQTLSDFQTSLSDAYPRGQK